MEMLHWERELVCFRSFYNHLQPIKNRGDVKDVIFNEHRKRNVSEIISMTETVHNIGQMSSKNFACMINVSSSNKPFKCWTTIDAQLL